MPNSKKTHEDCRKTVCIFCLKKCTRELNNQLINTIETVLQMKLDISDSRVPKGICDTCRIALGKKKNGENVSLPLMFQFETIKVRSSTREQDCDCLICQIGHLKSYEKHPLETSSEHSQSSSNQKRCSECLSILGKGISHNCSDFSFRENMRKLAMRDSLVSEQIAASVVTVKEASPHGTVKLAQSRGGRPLCLTKGT